jgi:hypothetical protein
MSAVDDVRLNELDLVESWDLARTVLPSLPWDEYEQDWAEFQRSQALQKARRAIQ